MKARNLLSVLALLAGTPAAAGQPTALFLLDAQPNVRLYSMGGAMTALAQNDAAYHPWELGYTVIPSVSLAHWPGAVQDSNYNFVSALAPAGRFGTFSLSYLSYGTGSETFQELDGSSRSIKLEDNKLLSLGYGRAITQRLFAGGSVKSLSSTLAEDYKATALLADVGLVWRTLDDRHSIGAALVNYGGGLKYSETEEDLPTEIKLGYTYKTRPLPGQKVVWGLGYASSQISKNYSLGAEYFPGLPFVSLRAGVNKGNDQTRFVAGLGFNYNAFNLDFGYDLSADKMEEDQSAARFGLTWSFGGTDAYAVGEKFLARGMKSKALALWEDVRPAEPMYAQARNAIRQYANPPELYAEARLEDSNGDGALSPGESGRLVITVGNRGRGYAAAPRLRMDLPGTIRTAEAPRQAPTAQRPTAETPASPAETQKTKADKNEPGDFSKFKELVDISLEDTPDQQPPTAEKPIPPAEPVKQEEPAPSLKEPSGAGLMVGSFDSQLTGLEPGQTAVVSVPVSASAEAERARPEIVVNVQDARGFAAAPLLFAFDIKGFSPPQLSLARYTFKEDGTGNSEGNGNGIIEAGERVEVTGYVANSGLTEARKAAWAPEGGRGLKVYSPQEQSLGTLAPGQFKKIVFNFSLDTGYTAPEQLPLTINFTEERPRFGRAQPLKLALGSFYRDPIEPVSADIDATAALAAMPQLPGPVSDAQARVIAEQIAAQPPALEFEAQTQKDGDLNNNGVYEPGETLKIKVAVRNTGGQTARGVRATVSGDEIAAALLGAQEAGDIPPGGSRILVLQARIPGNIPRKESVFNVKVLETRGFSATRIQEARVAFQPKEVKVIKQLASLLPVPNTNAGRRANSGAIVVGIGAYGESVGDLKYAAKDAQLAAQYISGALGVPENNIKVLLDEKATKSRIEAEVAKMAEKGLDFVALYYSGHGVPDPADQRTGDPYIVPVDADLELGGRMLIRLRDIVTELEGKTKDVLVLLDACFSGNPLSAPKAFMKEKGIGIVPKFEQEKAVVIAGSESTQPSLEFEKAGHGYFSYYFMLGLKGEADKNKDGAVTDTELCAYTRAAMSADETLDGRQTPQCSNPSGKILGKY